jgi:hypothetical protein
MASGLLKLLSEELPGKDIQVGGFPAVFAGTWQRWMPQRELCGLRPIQV